MAGPRYIRAQELAVCLAALGWKRVSRSPGRALVAYTKRDAQDVVRVLVLPSRGGYTLQYLLRRLSGHHAISLQDVVSEYKRQFGRPPPPVPM